MTQMEQWSILSNILNYVQHSRFNSMNYMLNVKAVNKYKSNRQRIKRIRFWYSATKNTRGIYGHI